jgi:hypothetical protein
MPKQWMLIFDEIALGGSLYPVWPAVRAICAELSRQGLFSEEAGRFAMTAAGLSYYEAHRGAYVSQARAHLEGPELQK